MHIKRINEMNNSRVNTEIINAYKNMNKASLGMTKCVKDAVAAGAHLNDEILMDYAPDFSDEVGTYCINAIDVVDGEIICRTKEGVDILFDELDFYNKEVIYRAIVV
jgi:hypothetical protein